MDSADAAGAPLAGESGLLQQLSRALLERALQAAMTDDLGCAKGDPAGRGSGNSRNGTAAKTVLTDVGPVEMEVPRDRNADFEPQIVPKSARRLSGFDEQVLALDARGMSMRDIRSYLAKTYGTDVPPDLTSKATDAVNDEITARQPRPLDAVWPVAYIDALWIKVREGKAANRPVYLAVGVDLDGCKHVLGLWISKDGDGDRAVPGDKQHPQRLAFAAEAGLVRCSVASTSLAARTASSMPVLRPPRLAARFGRQTSMTCSPAWLRKAARPAP
ncbi:transposase [Streptomyces olivoreticuli]